MVTLLAVSDIHGKIRHIPKLVQVKRDITLVAGDLTHFGSVDEAYSILKELRSQGPPVVFVPGNCDPRELLELSWDEEGIFNAHCRCVEIAGVKVFGIGGSNITPFSTLIEFGEERIAEMLERGVECVGNGSGILLTHVPPYGTKLDRAMGTLHVGSKALHNFIKSRKPIVCVCGHIHESRGVDNIDSVVAVNPGPLARGYYAIVEVVGNKCVKAELFKF